MNAMIPEKNATHPRRGRFGYGVSSFLNSIADAGLDLIGRKSGDANTAGKHTDIEVECNALLSTLGEASGTAIARRVMDRYEAMDEAEQIAFFKLLRERFHVDFEEIKQVATELGEKGDDATLERFLKIAEPRRQELFRRLNMAPNGTQSLVDMRRVLLSLVRKHPELKPVDSDLSHLFTSWFNRGFLTLRSIDWGTPAAVLEKLIEYETVHEMRGWDDLRRRLAPDRRCFAFFHSALPDDPLVFVEVALVKGISRDIDPIIGLDRDETDLAEVDTAIFYSINNCLEGLTGISFGNFLIKQVVVELAKELPQLTTYSTLSPVPGFSRWMNNAILADEDSKLISDDERALLTSLENVDWHQDDAQRATLQPLLTRLIAHYLVIAKRGKNPADPVARFHLRNGARLDQINWLGDTSDERMKQSFGFLVNYVYDLGTIEKNHETYVKDFQVVTSGKVGALAKTSIPADNA